MFSLDISGLFGTGVTALIGVIAVIGGMSLGFRLVSFIINEVHAGIRLSDSSQEAPRVLVPQPEYVPAPPTASYKFKYPRKCPACAATVRPDELQHSGDAVFCGYCGSVIEPVKES